MRHVIGIDITIQIQGEGYRLKDKRKTGIIGPSRKEKESA